MKESFRFKLSERVKRKGQKNMVVIFSAERIEKHTNIYRISWDSGYNDYSGSNVEKHVKDGNWIIVD